MRVHTGVKIGMGAAGIVAFICLVIALTQVSTLQVLEPKGTIAESQRDLLVVATILMLVIVLPVFALTFFIAWRYRETNTKATYSPGLHGSRLAEALWWGLPLIIITILSVIIWKSSHELDPYKPLVSDVAPVRVQVIALQWKWLFLYPDQNLATINYLKIPVNTPINFELTADAPMNSMWIPQLGGQVYAMAGMTTKLHLMANEPGVYAGSSSNISGEGFSGMRFNAEAVPKQEFDQWVTSSKSDSKDLNKTTYATLAKPSKNNSPLTYGTYEPNLYDTIVMKYMRHGTHSNDATKHNGEHDHAH